MTTYPKRLIEVDLPIARISAHARHEKSIRHGHISTLHIWWARRPLAACRAVICATLWPDPVDLAAWESREDGVTSDATGIRPERFLLEARRQMSHRIQQHAVKASPDSLPRLFAVQKEPSKLDDPVELRALLLDFIADFADWDNSTDADYVAMARSLTEAAHEALGGEAGTRPLVVDPFAGGGSIPLEALRVGADAFASDLNPVAVLLNKVVLEYIPEYGQHLADEVRKWGQWVASEAEKDLSRFYPSDSDGAKPMAYLWARTVVSEAPGEEIPVEVPLIRTMWLSTKPKKRAALRWTRDANGDVDTEICDVTYSDGTNLRVRRPRLEVFEPAREGDVEGGTVAKGSATCPVTGFTTPLPGVKAQLAARRGGADDARLLCVVSLHPGKSGRQYRIANVGDEIGIERAVRELESREKNPAGRLSARPSEPISTNERRRISIPIYGMTTWGSVFTSRQALSLTVLSEAVSRVACDGEAEDSAPLNEAVRTCLALAVSKLADLSNSLVCWKQDAECPVHLFARQAIPMVWDFAEAVPLSGSSGSWQSMYERTAYSIAESAFDQPWTGTPVCASATKQPLPDDSAHAVVTDPPYYDAVPYAHLSDFFYVWLRRTLIKTHPELMRESVIDKDAEIVVDRPHHLSDSKKDVAYYERELQAAFSESRRIAKPSGVATVVFASKTTASWEAILNALISAGWCLNASWPIDTEMETRVAAQGQARLASSVHLVCRPRENPDGSLREETGEWREILAELPTRIHEWMPRLASEGVVGADAIFACLGPALEVFSRYSRVEKSSGEVVDLHEYLEQVWAAVSQEALSMIFDDPETVGLEPDARLTAMWLWTLNAGGSSSEPVAMPGGDLDDEESAGGLPTRSGRYTLEFDAARKIAQGLGIDLEKSPSVVEVKADQARLLPVAERTRYLFGKNLTDEEPAKKPKRAAQLDLFAELQEIDAHVQSTAPELVAPAAGTTVLDRVHQGMILFAAGRGEALKRFLVEDSIGRQPNFWKLAQALSALYPAGSQEKRWVDGLLARKKGLGL